MNSNIVTRMAPSPTGVLHVGTLRTTLFNYLYARKHGGKFILRIEDTDKERSTKEFEKNILDGIEWAGLNYDELYRQSERTEIYKKYVKELLESGSAYVSEEKEGANKTVIRFRNPNQDIAFKDEVRGEVKFNTSDLGDFVIAKDEETPLYHLAVVIDDHEMGVTHVLRGEDHISNTPRQILIQRAIGAKEPTYAHFPLILASDRSKLSKRHGAVSVDDYKEMGYLPEALINFLALIGWNPGTEQEVFDLKDLVKNFSLNQVQKGGGIFNIEKLDWLNREHLRKLPEDKIITMFNNALTDEIKNLPNYNDEQLKKVVPILFDYIHKAGDLTQMAERGEVSYFFDNPKLSLTTLQGKKEIPLDQIKKHLKKIYELLEIIDEKNFTAQVIKENVWDYASEEGRGEVLWPMRVALSGLEKSPDPFVISEVLGKEETLKRLGNVQEL